MLYHLTFLSLPYLPRLSCVCNTKGSAQKLGAVAIEFDSLVRLQFVEFLSNLANTEVGSVSTSSIEQRLQQVFFFSFSLSLPDSTSE